MRIIRNFNFFQSFCLIFLLLQALAFICCLLVNLLVGYFASLLICTIFCLALIFTSDPFLDKPDPLSQWLLVANVWIGLLILIIGPVQARGLRQYSEQEVWLLLLIAICLFVSRRVICRTKSAKELFFSYESRKLVLIFVFLAAISVMLHYNLSYEAAAYGRSANISFERNFITHLWTMSVCLLGIAIIPVIFWHRRMRRIIERPTSWHLMLLGLLAIGCVGFAIYMKISRWRYAAAPLQALYLALPFGAAALSNERFHSSARALFAFIGIGGIALSGALYVDNGVGITILCIFILLVGCAFFTHRIHSRKNENATTETRSRAIIRKAADKPWLWPAAVFGPFILVPLFLFVVLNFNLVGKTIQERTFVMFYPAPKAEFATQMFAAQVLMRDAVRWGGITGDGFWHNEVKLPQLNSDMIVGPTFFYLGLFGYCILLLVAALIAQIGRMLTRKDMDGDEDRALPFINFGFGALLVIAIPALWLMGAMSLNLPLTGIVFPFLARGAYFQVCLGVLLAFVVFFDLCSCDRPGKGESESGASLSLRRRLKDLMGVWKMEPLALIRMVRWTLLCLAILASYYVVSFAKLVHFPVLAGQEGDKKYIVIPDNDDREIDLDLQKTRAGGYRIGNTIVEAEIPTDSEAIYSDPFVYISQYSFNRDEAYRGITIGQAGELSPILDFGLLTGNYRYAHKKNDIIVFWEKDIGEEAHLTLKPEKNKLRAILGSVSRNNQKTVAEVRRLQDGKWIPLQDGEMLESDSRIRVGSTVLQVSLDEKPEQFLTITLEPDRPARASVLHNMQGEKFVLSRTRPNVIGGLQMAVKDIDSERLPNDWGSRFKNQFEKRASIRDRSDNELMRPDEKREGAWYADQNLFFTIGTRTKEAGLDYTFDPILSGKSGTNRNPSVLSATMRSIHNEKISGQDLTLTYNLDIQRAVTKTLDTFLKGRPLQSASAIILNSDNEVLATAQYSKRKGETFRFQPDQEGGDFLPFDKEFSDVWEKIDDRPLDADSYANPLLRRPLCDAFKTDLVGSAIKGVLYAAALSDHAQGRHDHFLFGSSLENSYIRAIEGDHRNTMPIGEEKVFGATRTLVPFAAYDFHPVGNYRKSVISTNLYDAFRKSSNTASCYLAMRLQIADRLEFAFRRFMFENHLLLRSSIFENRLNSSRYVKAEVTRYADGFNRSNASDVLRIGIGDKIYLSLLHLATFYSTVLINNGEFIHPTIVQKIGEGIIPKQRYDILDRRDREFVIPSMKKLARSVLLEGTAKSFSRKLRHSEVAFIGGKTGTASLPNNDPREHKIFIACIEVNGSRYTIACRVNYAQSGTDLAVELAARIVQNALLNPASGN